MGLFHLLLVPVPIPGKWQRLGPKHFHNESVGARQPPLALLANRVPVVVDVDVLASHGSVLRRWREFFEELTNAEYERDEDGWSRGSESGSKEY